MALRMAFRGALVSSFCLDLDMCFMLKGWLGWGLRRVGW